MPRKSISLIKISGYVVAGLLLQSAVTLADINDPLFEAVSATNTTNAKPLINARLKDTLDFGPGHHLWEGAVVRSQDMFKLYMENGQDVMMNEDPDEIAAWLKTVADNLDIYDLLLQAVRNPRQLERYRAEMFLHAILEGHSPVVDLLLARGYSPEVRNDSGATPLMLAAGQGHLNIMKTLMEKGVSPDSQSMTESALTLAISSGGPKAVSLLIDSGAKIDLPLGSGETPLFVIVRDDNKKAFDLLLAAGIKFDVRSRWGRTPLMEAVAYGRNDMILPLIEKGVDVNAADVRGNTALMIAARERRAQAVKMLLENKADINARNADGLTPLMHAVTRPKNGEVISALLGMGADAEDKSATGQTALEVAQASGHPEYAPLLKIN